jgi:hypothetical protein
MAGKKSIQKLRLSVCCFRQVNSANSGELRMLLRLWSYILFHKLQIIVLWHFRSNLPELDRQNVLCALYHAAYCLYPTAFKTLLRLVFIPWYQWSPGFPSHVEIHASLEDRTRNSCSGRRHFDMDRSSCALYLRLRLGLDRQMPILIHSRPWSTARLYMAGSCDPNLTPIK